jgi:hypothetical protein
MISVVQESTQTLESSSAEELDLIFEELPLEPAARYALRRLPVKPFIYGSPQDMLRDCISLAIKIDEINAAIIPITHLQKKQYKTRRLGGGGDVISVDRAILVELGGEFSMASGNIPVDGLRIYSRWSKEFAAAIKSGRAPFGFHRRGRREIYVLGRPADGETVQLTEEVVKGVFSSLLRDYNWSDWLPSFGTAEPPPTFPVVSLPKGPPEFGGFIMDGLAGIFDLHKFGCLYYLFGGNTDDLRRRLAAEASLRAARALRDKELAKLATIKKIIFDKFAERPNGTVAEILAGLTVQQRKIVDAEFNSRARFEKGAEENPCEHRRILRRVLRGIEKPEALNDYIPAKRGEYIDCGKCGFPLICAHTLEEWKGGRVDDFAIGLATGVFCRVCGAKLPSIKIEVIQQQLDEEFAEEIWGEMLILRRYLAIPPSISPPKLFRGVRGEIYGAVRNMCIQAERSKTASADEIKARKKIYIGLGILCWFVHHQTGGGAIKFADFTPQRGKETPTLLLHCIKIILSTYSASLRAVPSITAETLKTMIITMYREINIGSEEYGNDALSSAELVKFVSREPYYRFLYRMKQMTTKEICRGPPSKYFATLLTPPAPPKGKKAAVVGSIWLTAASPKVSGHVAKIWEHTMEMVRIGAHAADQYDVKVISKRGKIIELTALLTDEAKSARAATAELNAAEIAAYEAAAVRRPIRLPTPPNYDTPHFAGQARRRTYNGAPLSLPERYGVDGHKHKWDLLVIDGKDYDLGQYCKALPEGRPASVKCTVCKITREDAAEAEEAAVAAAIAAKAEEENFFRFYTFRCPVNKIHTPNCSCGWARTHEYYKKYRSQYLIDKAPAVPPAPAALPLPETPELDEYQYNFDVITDLAAKLQINYRLLASLGGYEREDLAKVESGEYVPREVESRYATRVFKIIGYIRALCVEYNQLRNLNSIAAPPKKILDFALAQIPRAEFAKLIELPPVPPNILSTVEFRRRTMKPSGFLEAILQIFCELLAKISVHPIGMEFVKGFVSGILSGEALVSKPGYFNWGLIYGKPLSEKQEEEADDTGEAEKENDDEEGDVMSMDAFDVEKDEEGDEPNLIRLDGVD